MRVLFPLLFLLLASCLNPPEKKQDAKSPNATLSPNDPEAKKTAALFGTSEFLVNYDSLLTTDGYKQYIELILKNVKVPPVQKEQNKLVSVVALNFFDAMSESRRREYDVFKIKIVNENNSFNGSYQTNTIGWASLMSKIVDGFFRQQQDSAFLVLDPRFIPDSTHSKIRDMVSNLLPGTKNITYKITAFADDVLQETGETIEVYTVETQGKQRMVEFTFFVSRETAQIVYLHID